MALATLSATACADGFDDPVETEVGDAELCEDVATWESDWVAWEDDLVRELNAARAQPLACGDEAQMRQRALAVVPELVCAARVQARELAEVGELTHAGPAGNYVSRSAAAGYAGVPTAELLAIDVNAPPRVAARWIAEAESCRALLGPPASAAESRPFSDEVGVGLYRDADEIPHWVVALGQAR